MTAGALSLFTSARGGAPTNVPTAGAPAEVVGAWRMAGAPMVVVKKSGKKPPLSGQDENNTVLGGTLEDYFNSKKASQSEQMRDVSKHLLTGSGPDNAMVMEREDGEAPALGATAHPDEVQVAQLRDEEAARAVGATEEPTKGDAERGTGDGEPDDYEEDYESDSSAPEKSVAGMTLSDYLKAKGVDDDEAVHDEGDGPDHVHRAEAKGPKPPVEKVPHPAAVASTHGGHKKPPPPALISGMSLDYYLGASSAAMVEDVRADELAESKSPGKRRKQQRSTAKATTGIGVLPLAKQHQQYAEPKHHDEHLTPFQKRTKRKAKVKQQCQLAASGATTRSILLGDSHSSSQLLMSTTSLPAAAVATTTTHNAKDKKRKGSGGTSKPPLPKLLGASSSAHGFLPATNGSRDVESESDADGEHHEDEEKLPPLQHK